MKRLAYSRCSPRSSPMVHRPGLQAAMRGFRLASCLAALPVRDRGTQTATIPAARALPRMHVRVMAVQRIELRSLTMRFANRSLRSGRRPPPCGLCHWSRTAHSRLCSMPGWDSAAARAWRSSLWTSTEKMARAMQAAAGTMLLAPADAAEPRAQRSHWKTRQAPEEAVRVSAQAEQVAPARSTPLLRAQLPHAPSCCRLPSVPALLPPEAHHVGEAHARRGSIARRLRRAR